MRKRAIGILACSSLASVGWSGDRVVMQGPVRLYTAEDFASLRATNFDHYQRAERLMVAANRLCLPGAPKVQKADLHNSDDLSCGHAFLTSNPPKREISFTLDGTQYVAMVTITASPPKPMNVH